MPIYMDRHDVSDSVTAENVAALHQEDLKVQQQFGCRGLTYWFDDIRKTAFCLVEAPDKEAIIKMHNLAHGEVPHQIIEVEASIVESFLGRIEDPDKALNTELNIINDPAFRTIMAVAIEYQYFKNYDPFSNAEKLPHVYRQMAAIFKLFEGNVVEQNENGFLISFKSVTNAVLCALKVQDNYKIFKNQYKINFAELRIGLHAGVPVTGKKSIFEDTIKLAARMHFVSRAEIVVSEEVRHLYESENLGNFVDTNQVYVLTSSEEKFITDFMEFTEKEWQNTGLKVNDFGKNIGISKSKLYRKMIQVTGKSPHIFLLHYRLQKSLQQLQKQKGNISEVAFDSGFNSPSYFAKCFRKKYGIMPSALYISVHS
ncbi:MAG TPA: nickel-binding protein [Draconibacterium sp.]|nr:nickel-binding protein [Draconibacterium sp.]